MRSETYRRLPALALVLLATQAAYGQDPDEPGVEVVPGEVVAAEQPAAMEGRLTDLEEDVAALREELQEKEDENDVDGWQLQLRGGWVHLHDEADDFTGDEEDTDGWMGGVALRVPLWHDADAYEDNPWSPEDDGGDDGEVPFGLFGRIALEYRQITDEWDSPITGDETTLNYLNIIAAPELRFPFLDVLVPFIYGGPNVMITALGLTESQIEVGIVAGAGLEVRVHRRISVGMDYQWTWFGIADREDADYGQLAAFVGFNF